MNTRAIITFILVLIIVALGVSAIYVFNKNKATYDLTNSDSQSTTQGTVMIGLTDAAANMENITAITVSVNNIQIHNQAQGWITLSSNPSNHDLLALKNTNATVLLAQTNVAAGIYDQMRLSISKVMVTENGTQKEAKLPSGEIKIMGTLVVDANKTSTAVFDILADKSLHTTGNGKLIFTPVVKVQTKNDADASVDSNNRLSITKGQIIADINAGMTVDGEMKTDFMLTDDITFAEIGSVIKIGTADEKDKTIKIDANGAINSAVNNKYLDSVTSVAFVVDGGKKMWVVSGLKNLLITSVYIDAITGAQLNY